MRKIISTTTYDQFTFEAIKKIVIKDENGKIEEIQHNLPEPKKEKYTEEEQKKINLCNTVLTGHGHPEMTEEEIEFMLDPAGLKKLEKLPDDPSAFQALAGFKIEKKIIYTKETA